MGVDEIIRIMLVDDYAPVRHFLRIMLTEVPGIEVIAEAEDGKTAIELMHKLLPDIVIIDVDMPVMDGIETTRWITTVYPDVKVIAFTSSDDNDTVKSMIEAGASAYMIKGCGFGQILSAIRTVAQGKKLCAVTTE